MEFQEFGLSILLLILLTNFTKASLKFDTKENKRVTAYAKSGHLRPTKCQVCRVFAQELWIAVNDTSKTKQNIWLTNRLDGEDMFDERKGKKINYKTSELRLDDILENLCKKVYDYRSIDGPEFPYLKGVPSMFRQQLQEAMGTSGLKLSLNAPEEIIDDPTGEVKRMHYHCNQLIEENEEDIIDWYLHRQEKNPLDEICAATILKSNQLDCLKASTEIPEKAKTGKDNNPFTIAANNEKKSEL